MKTFITFPYEENITFGPIYYGQVSGVSSGVTGVSSRVTSWAGDCGVHYVLGSVPVTVKLILSLILYLGIYVSISPEIGCVLPELLPGTIKGGTTY
jgi:hypothetical protein